MCLPGIGTEYTTVIKTDKNPCSHRAAILMGETEKINKIEQKQIKEV